MQGNAKFASKKLPSMSKRIGHQATPSETTDSWQLPLTRFDLKLAIIKAGLKIDVSLFKR